jgi:anti-sigma B factor antagonist
MTNPEETLADAGDPGMQEPVGLSQEQESARLLVVVRELPEATVVAIGGEVDLLTAPQLTAEVEPILAVEHRHIAIDLTETSFMDSAGIHALVNLGNQARRHFAVICPPGTVRRTLELVGLAEALCVVDSLDEYRRRRAGS